MKNIFKKFIELFKNPFYQESPIKEPVTSKVQVRQVSQEPTLNTEAIFKYAKSNSQAKAAEKFNISIDEVKRQVKAYRDSLKTVS